MMKVKTASSQYCTSAGHHPIGISLSKDEGASII